MRESSGELCADDEGCLSLQGVTVPVERRLDIYLDGAAFNAYNLALDPGREQSIIAVIPAQVVVVEAQLAGEDALPADDRALLMDTLQAFLAHAGSTDRAAEVTGEVIET